MLHIPWLPWHQKYGYMNASMIGFVVIYATSDYMTTIFLKYYIKYIDFCIQYNIVIHSVIYYILYI